MAALLAAASAVGLDPAALAARLLRYAEVPFDSDRKRMTTAHHRLNVQPGYGMRYAVPGRPGCVGMMVGRFRAGVPGRYRMWVNQSDPAATIAVGNDINLRVLPSLVGAGAVLILTAAGALGLVITTWYRRSRPADDR